MRLRGADLSWAGAQRSLRRGLIHAVAAVLEMVTDLAAAAPVALRSIKRNLDDADTLSPTEAPDRVAEHRSAQRQPWRSRRKKRLERAMTVRSVARHNSAMVGVASDQLDELREERVSYLIDVDVNALSLTEQKFRACGRNDVMRSRGLRWSASAARFARRVYDHFTARR